jgi:glycosyltransferase involved in cell wall biosynthesis
VLRQTYENQEVLVWDDGSKDGTMAIINEFANRNPKVKIFDE